ncbi:MAG: ABC transporter permease [Roseivirga sp.]
MLKNYLNIATRNLGRQKVYSFINIIGLSVGIMACIIILLYVQDESSYEKFYPDADKILRVTTHYETSGDARKIAITPKEVTEVSLNQIPETALATLVFDWRVGREILTRSGDNVFTETEVFFADSSFFRVFQHRFLEGDPASALAEPSAVVLTESTALKYFNRTENIVGQVLNANGRDYKITGLIEDIPGNTALQFNFVISAGTLGRQLESYGWFPMNYFTYVVLNDNVKPETYTAKLNKILDDDIGEELKTSGTTMFYETQPISEMYFNTALGADYPGKMSKNLIYSLLAIAAFILLIACINYINLSTAKSERRAKEVGLRKVMGAVRSQLIAQFYAETLMLTTLAVVLGVVLAEVSLPAFNRLASTQLDILYFEDSNFLVGVISFIFFVSLISGSYPATFLSAFQPVKVLKGTHQIKGGNLFRRVLVIVQFSVSVFLIVGTLIIYNQLNFMQSKEMGYDTEQIVYMKLPDRDTRNNFDPLKAGFESITGVDYVTYSNNMISDVKSGWSAKMEGLPSGVTISFKGMNGDQDFLETFGLELVAGEGYQNKTNWRTQTYYLMNETGVQALGLTPEEAIGKKFGLNDNLMGAIVGVVKDFHSASLHQQIDPIAVYTGPDDYKNLLFARVNTQRMEPVLAQMEQQWEELNPQRPFEPEFLDGAVQEMYEAEQRLGKIILIFTSLAISIGCLGLFGLASYMAEKKTKEIGIRKVLGADVSRIILMLSREYVRIILISNLIAWPLAYYAMNRWLEGFAFRVDISWQLFLLAGLSTAAVALFTVSFQSVKAAVTNPIKALRTE